MRSRGSQSPGISPRSVRGGCAGSSPAGSGHSMSHSSISQAGSASLRRQCSGSQTTPSVPWRMRYSVVASGWSEAPHTGGGVAGEDVVVHGLVGRDGAERSLVPAELGLCPDHRAEDRVALLLELGGLPVGGGPVPRIVGIQVVEDVGHVVRDVALPRCGQLHGDPEGRGPGRRGPVLLSSHAGHGLRGRPLRLVLRFGRCCGLAAARCLWGAWGLQAVGPVLRALQGFVRAGP